MILTLILDIWEESNIPQQNVISLLVHLAKNRKKQTFMNILKFVNDILSTTSTEQEKDGALCIMSALAPIVLESKKIVPMMEPFFVNYVFPIFKSECPFLRARVSHDKKEKRERRLGQILSIISV